MRSSNLKMLIVLPHLACGGTERTAAELANFIVKKGGDVTLILMYKREKFYRINHNVNIVEPNCSKNQQYIRL